MSECMISTPNLEGGVNSSDLITSFAMLEIIPSSSGKNEYIELSFSPKHIYFISAAGYLFMTNGVRPYSVDLIDGRDYFLRDITTTANVHLLRYEAGNEWILSNCSGTAELISILLMIIPA